MMHGLLHKSYLMLMLNCILHACILQAVNEGSLHLNTSISMEHS